MTPQAFERWGITAGLSTRERPGKSLPATQTCSEGGTISEMIPSGRVLVSMAPVIDVQAEQASRGNTADAWGVIEDAGSEEEEEMAVGRQVAATHLEQVPSSFHAEDVSAIGQEDPFLHDWKAALKRMHATCRPSEDTLRSQTQAAELLLKQSVRREDRAREQARERGREPERVCVCPRTPFEGGWNWTEIE
eukprot:1407895-Rhodomonas_salina.1